MFGFRTGIFILFYDNMKSYAKKREIYRGNFLAILLLFRKINNFCFSNLWCRRHCCRCCIKEDELLSSSGLSSSGLRTTSTLLSSSSNGHSVHNHSAGLSTKVPQVQICAASIAAHRYWKYPILCSNLPNIPPWLWQNHHSSQYHLFTNQTWNCYLWSRMQP